MAEIAKIAKTAKMARLAKMAKLTKMVEMAKMAKLALGCPIITFFPKGPGVLGIVYHYDESHSDFFQNCLRPLGFPAATCHFRHLLKIKIFELLQNVSCKGTIDAEFHADFKNVYFCMPILRLSRVMAV